MRHFCEGLTLARALLVSFFVLGSLSGVGSAVANAADERAALQLIRASHLAATGQCAEAMSIAEASTPRDAATERLIGKCAIQAQQYTKALFSLTRASELDPSLAGLSLYRAVALYHLEDYPAARTKLADPRVTRGLGAEAALVDFYSGLLLLREDRPRAAALAFERAAVRGPKLVEPVASYYAALAWQSLDENEPLKSAADRVIDEEPAGVWSREAKSLLALQAKRHRRGQVDLQRWASLKAGLEFDSNVVLRGDNSNPVLSGTGGLLPSTDNDVRGVWSLVLGAELFELAGNTFGSMLSYAGNAHDDLDTFDQHYIAASGWVDRELRPTTLVRLRANLGYGWFDGDPFVLQFDFAGLVEERWGRWGTTRCSLGMEVADYRYDLAGVFSSIIDQDGIGVLLGCDHELPVNLSGPFNRIEPTVYAGYHFKRFFADGIEWDETAHAIQFGVRAKLPQKVDLDLSATYTRRDFEKESYFLVPAQDPTGPVRAEDGVQFDFELAREFDDWIELSARYQFVDSGSNTPRLDYKRHIVGMYAEVKFP